MSEMQIFCSVMLGLLVCIGILLTLISMDNSLNEKTRKAASIIEAVILIIIRSSLIIVLVGALIKGALGYYG